MKFGMKLKLARVKKQLTQQQVAEQIGIKQPSYHEWECGKSKPNWDRMVELSRVLEISLDELAKEE